MTPAQQILLYRLGSLGDTCVALPALRVVRRHFPQARLTLLTNLPVSVKAAPAPALLEGLGLVDDYLAYPVGTRNPLTLARLALTLRRRRFAGAVNLAAWRGERALRRDARFFRACGIRRLWGFDPAAPHALRCTEAGGVEPEAERLLRRVAALGRADLHDRRWFDLELGLEERQRARQLLDTGGVSGTYLAFSVGTKFPANDWGQDNWRAVIRAVGEANSGLGAVAVGSADESPRADECLREWPGARLNLCGRTSPRASAAVLCGARVFLGHDSGPMHLAAAVATPCVAIFSARNPPGQWFPLGAGHEVLYRRVPCHGCGLEDCVVERKRCLREISVDDVVSAVSRQLERTMPRRPANRTAVVHPAADGSGASGAAGP